MSVFQHCAPFPDGVYWQSYMNAMASDKCVTNWVSPASTRVDASYRVVPEPPPETQVTSQPREGKSPYLLHTAAEISYLPPSDSTSCPATSSISCGRDAPVPLRTGSQRRGPNHVPRPLNCFFLFKTDWLAKRKSLLAGIEQDHRQLNRMASSEWRKLPPEAKQRFKDAAYQAKVEHSMKYPGYRFMPKPRGDRRRRKTKRNEPEVLLRNEEAARLVSQGATGDALREGLAEYDRRCAEERCHSTVSSTPPPSISEGSPSTPSVSPSVIHPPPSLDVNQSPNWAPLPTTSFLDLETLWDTFTGSSRSVPWVGEVAPSQQSPQVVPAEPARDPHLFGFDHLSDDFTGLFPPSTSPSTQLFRMDQQIQHRIDEWDQQLVPLVDSTGGTISYQVFQPLTPSAAFVQSTSDDSTISAYQSVPIFQANNIFHASAPMAYSFPL